jgi:nicotinamide-nucleotide amidase
MEAPGDERLLDLAARAGARMAAAGERLAVVESCTGGWIAKALTDVAGSSAWLEGALVTYGNAAKERLAGVSGETLAHDGAVSEATVREMALGALARLDVDRAVAVSGIAGPTGGSADKPVGTVWIAWARRDVAGRPAALRTRHLLLAGDREAVRRQAVAAALAGLLDGD